MAKKPTRTLELHIRHVNASETKAAVDDLFTSASKSLLRAEQQLRVDLPDSVRLARMNLERARVRYCLACKLQDFGVRWPGFEDRYNAAVATVLAREAEVSQQTPPAPL